MIFDKSLAKNDAQNIRNMDAQFAAINKERQMSETVGFGSMKIPPQFAFNSATGQQMKTNAGINPQDLFREFDRTTVEEFRLDEGDAILNPLMGLSRSLPYGRTIYQFTRASDAGNFQQSMSGEIGTVFDNVDYDSDKTLIPVNTTGYKRNHREYEQLTLEDFDDVVNLQREDVRRHRNGLIDSFLDGHKDNDGNLIQHDGVAWGGVRSDARVDQVTLTVDLTSRTATQEAIRNQFLALVERRYITNKITEAATFFVSNEIYFNLQRNYNEQFEWGGNLLMVIKTLTGIVDIVPSSKLIGNQVLSFPMSNRYVQPLVGRGLGSIQCPRLKWNDPYAWENVSAIGWMIKTDFGSTNRAVQYASS